MRHVAMPRFHNALCPTIQIAAFLNPQAQVSGLAGSPENGAFFIFIIQPAIEIGVSRHKGQRHVFITRLWGSGIGFTHPTHYFI